MQFHIGYVRYIEPETIQESIPGNSHHIALPLGLVFALLLVILLGLSAFYMYRKKLLKANKAKTLGDAGLYRSKSMNKVSSTSPSMPPLPIYSVFGPQRIQGQQARKLRQS